jgi:hypothetical protein
MATKYGKYILIEPQAAAPSTAPPPEMPPEAAKKPSPPVMKVNSSLIDTIPVEFAFVGMTKPSDPAQPGHPSHTHDVDEFIYFVGGNPENMFDFGAEIEITLGAGEDEEKHIINKACVVYVPKGLPHLPITFKKVDKPILWGHLLMAPVYSETRL